MPLYIRDDEVAALARKVQGLTKSRTLTEAVRAALEHEIERQRKQIAAKCAPRKERGHGRRSGSRRPRFRYEKFADEMWGE